MFVLPPLQFPPIWADSLSQGGNECLSFPGICPQTSKVFFFLTRFHAIMANSVLFAWFLSFCHYKKRPEPQIVSAWKMCLRLCRWNGFPEAYALLKKHLNQRLNKSCRDKKILSGRPAFPVSGNVNKRQRHMFSEWNHKEIWGQSKGVNNAF